MKVSDAIPDIPDFSDLFRATKELASELSKLSAMSKDVAAARTVKEFSSDRKKNALSKAVLQAFKEGSKSSAEAEHKAFASAQFETAMSALTKQYTEAEQAIAEWTVCSMKIESLRSIIAVHRQIAGIQ